MMRGPFYVFIAVYMFTGCQRLRPCGPKPCNARCHDLSCWPAETAPSLDTDTTRSDDAAQHLQRYDHALGLLKPCLCYVICGG
jgi:hypothetical protein